MKLSDCNIQNQKEIALAEKAEVIADVAQVVALIQKAREMHLPAVQQIKLCMPEMAILYRLYCRKP